MHPRVEQTADLLRRGTARARREIVERIPPELQQSVADRMPAGTTGTNELRPDSPYRAWAGPPLGAIDGLSEPVVTMVGDIALVQGVLAPRLVDETVTLEFGDGETALDSAAVEHRFPHPNQADQTTANAYEATFDASRRPAAATHLRVVCGDLATGWQSIPALPTPTGMPGVEALKVCPACGGSQFSPAGRRQQLSISTCQRCGLVMTSPRPAEDHTLMRYSERYFEEEYLPSQVLSPALRAHIGAILDRVEPGRAHCSRLFELGVGGGNLLTTAKGRGWDVTGTDVNPASVAHINKTGLDVRLENVDHATDLGGPFGAIVSEMSIEHVRRPDHFCALAADALAPGGTLVIYTVSAEGESFAEAGMASPLVGPAEHLFLFSAGSLTSLCERAGLRVESIWRNETADEIGIVASKRVDIANPAVPERL